MPKNEQAFPAKIAYDFASGLGSVNATNLFRAWAQFEDKH
jgi:hypothetical protein